MSSSDDLNRKKSQLATKQVTQNTPLRQARTCYDHLAGVAGGEIFKRMMDHNWLIQSNIDNSKKRVQYILTSKGIHALNNRKVDLSKLKQTKRFTAYGCPDWTEHADHLGGALGYLILDSLESSNYILRSKNRVVNVLKPIDKWFEEFYVIFFGFPI